jgi:AraC-like DNA-binding protein
MEEGFGMTEMKSLAPVDYDWQRLQHRSELQRLNRLADRVACALPPLRVGSWDFPVVDISWGSGIFNTSWANPLHRHSELQVEFCLAGEIEFAGESSTCLLGPGQGTVILPGLTHHWLIRQDAVMVGISVRVPNGDPLFAEALARLGERLIPLPAPEALANLLRHWAANLQDECDVWQLAEETLHFRLWLVRTLASLLRAVLPVSPALRQEASREHELCKRAVAFMQQNCALSIRACDVAQHMHLSLRHLNRMLLRQQHRTTGSMLQHIRLEASIRFMANPRLSLKEIAFQAGFCSPAHFSACFRKKYNLTPSVYRDRLPPKSD